MVARPPPGGETSATLQCVGPDTSAYHPRTPRKADGSERIRTHPPPHTIMKQRMRCQPNRRNHSSSEEHAPHPRSTSKNAKRRDARRSQCRPPSRNKTIRHRDRAHTRALRQRPLNRETRDAQLEPLTAPQPAADHPERTIEQGNHDSQTSPEENNTRVNDEPFHNEAHRVGTRTTTTRKPMLGAHATRVIERAGKWNMVTKTHLRSNLSDRVG